MKQAALALICLVAMFLLGAQSVPNFHVGGEGPTGFAGPEPEQLVSYHFKLDGSNTYTLEPKTPGNGLVITKVYWAGLNNNRTELELLENTTTTRFRMYIGPQHGSTGSPTRYDQRVMRDISPGIRFSSGGPITLKAPGNAYSVTLIGYRH